MTNHKSFLEEPTFNPTLQRSPTCREHEMFAQSQNHSTQKQGTLWEGTKNLKDMSILHRFFSVQKKLSKEQETQNYQADLEKKIELKMKK